MTRTLLEQAFGSKIDLYGDVLQCPRDASNAQLRKAYYKRARDFHPDKNAVCKTLIPYGFCYDRPRSSSHFLQLLKKDPTATIKFQAISFAYNYLKDPERRKDYDQDGVLPEENDMDDSGEGNDVNQDWKKFFDLIFGKVMSTQEIDSFALKYKMSPEEEADVLKYYTKFKGNLVKCLEFVMLSQERDVERWMEDYIQPAIDEGKVEDYPAALKSSRAKVQKKLAKAMKEEEEEVDNDETESEDSDVEEKAKPAKAKKATVKKAKPTKTKMNAKKKKKIASSGAPSQDLIAAIRGNRGGNPFASLGARYGVDMNNEDPLDDNAFAKIQSKFKKKK